MEKVILITSREIQASGERLPFHFKHSPGVESPDDYTSWENSYLVQFPIFWTKKISYFKNNSTGIDPNDDIKKANNEEEAVGIAEDVVNKIETKYKNKENPFNLGIFYKKINIKNCEFYVYLAEEYPFFSSVLEFDADRQRYLNALFAEIQEHQKEQTGQELEWEIYSHDKDWGENEQENTYQEDALGIILNKTGSEFTSLQAVLQNKQTVIHLFQHTNNKIHDNVKTLINYDE